MADGIKALVDRMASLLLSEVVPMSRRFEGALPLSDDRREDKLESGTLEKRTFELAGLDCEGVLFVRSIGVLLLLVLMKCADVPG